MAFLHSSTYSSTENCFISTFLVHITTFTATSVWLIQRNIFNLFCLVWYYCVLSASGIQAIKNNSNVGNFSMKSLQTKVFLVKKSELPKLKYNRKFDLMLHSQAHSRIHKKLKTFRQINLTLILLALL